MNAPRRHLVTAVRRGGRLEARPYVVDVDGNGRVTASRPLDGHETAATTVLYGVALDLDSNELEPV